MNIFSTRIIDCSACGSKNLKKILTIPNLSHVGVYCHNKDEEKNYPPVNNSLNICTKCGHGQLANALDPNFLYNKNFQHCTSCSMIARNANNWLYEFIIKCKIQKMDVIAEIGINDSFFLKKFIKKAKKLVGIDPILKRTNNKKKFLSDISPKFRNKFLLVGDFVENINFSEDFDKKPDLYVSNFVFEHIKDPFSVTRKILKEAKDDAIIVIGVPGSEFLYENFRFDQLSHQHYQQFTKHSLRIMIERSGGEIIKMSTNYPMWGHIAVAFKKKKNNRNKNYNTSKIFAVNQIENSLLIFKKEMDLLKKKLNSIRRKNFFGYGAAQNFPTFANFFKDDFPFEIILDDDPRRQNTFFPNYKYRIKKPHKYGYENSVGIITGPDYQRVLISRMSELNFEQIVIPFNTC